MYPIWKDGDSRYKDSWKGSILLSPSEGQNVFPARFLFVSESSEVVGNAFMCLSLFSRLQHSGGRVLFNVANDSPTLTGAKVTFTIDLEFPHKQKVLPNGVVVWAEDCTVNGETHTDTHGHIHTPILLLHSHSHSHYQEQSTASLNQFTLPRTLSGRLCFLMGHQ